MIHGQQNIKFCLFIYLFIVVAAHNEMNRKETTHTEPAGILAGPTSSLSVWLGTW
jgi:hypothetical protein